MVWTFFLNLKNVMGLRLKYDSMDAFVIVNMINGLENDLGPI